MTCANPACGNQIINLPKVKPKKYCSDSCRQIAWRSKGKPQVMSIPVSEWEKLQDELTRLRQIRDYYERQPERRIEDARVERAFANRNQLQRLPEEDAMTYKIRMALLAEKNSI